MTKNAWFQSQSRSTVADGVLAVAIAVLLSSCSTSAQTPEERRHAQRLESTGKPAPFDPSRYSDFDDYVDQTKEHLTAHMVFVDPSNSENELATATPFRTNPVNVRENTDCGHLSRPSKGIVLIHGLSDMPAAMQDLATAFSQKCFLSFSILLPAHGARPSEMLSVSATDWINAAQFSVSTLQSEVDEVYVGGFSLGGLIALQLAIDNDQIAGVFAFSPALFLHRSFFLDQTVWIRYIKKWLDTDPPDDPWRFESIPFNALAETQILSKSVREQLNIQPLKTPVFLAQSPDDAVVNAEINRQYFLKTMVNPNNKLISYSSTEYHIDDSDAVHDGRLSFYASHLPDQRILSYAHQAIHISPDNPHYGQNGSYRNCNHDLNTNSSAIEDCQESDIPYRGEVFGKAVKRYETDEFNSIARLTFNPQFKTLLDEIDGFLDTKNSSK